jgi:hypothetical protein
MKFGIHNSSWLDDPDPAQAFETVGVLMTVSSVARRASSHLTRRWRGMDSNFQFRARWAAVSRLQPTWGRSTVGAAGIIRAVVGLGKPIELFRRLQESSFTAA